jgi:hypothetical protein
LLRLRTAGQEEKAVPFSPPADYRLQVRERGSGGVAAAGADFNQPAIFDLMSA